MVKKKPNPIIKKIVSDPISSVSLQLTVIVLLINVPVVVEWWKENQRVTVQKLDVVGVFRQTWRILSAAVLMWWIFSVHPFNCGFNDMWDWRQINLYSRYLYILFIKLLPIQTRLKDQRFSHVSAWVLFYLFIIFSWYKLHECTDSIRTWCVVSDT